MLDPPPTCRLNMETQRLCMVGGEILSCYSISYLSRLNGVASTHTHAHAHAHAHTHRHRHRHTDTHVWTTMKCMATACRAPRRAEGGQGDHAGDFIRNFHIQHKSVGLHQILIGCSFGMEWGDGIHTSSDLFEMLRTPLPKMGEWFVLSNYCELEAPTQGSMGCARKNYRGGTSNSQ